MESQPFNFELLKELCETPGIPGREEAMRRVVARHLRELCDEVRSDALGNVIGTKRGSGGPRVMLAAHIDEIGFLVSHIEEKGFLRLQPVGGWDPRNMAAQRVHVHGFAGERLLGALMPATKPVHLLSDDDKKRGLKIEDFYVDLGLPGDEVRARVELGDPVTMARATERVGDTVLSKALDDRLSVFIMLEALRALGEHGCEVVAVATVQEEVGLRGAGTAAFALEPDIGIALDVTLANDFPGMSERDAVTHLGKGAAIKIMDGSLICNPRVVRHFRDVAEAHDIPYQMEILPRGGTDAGTIQRSRGGVASFTLSIPTRYLHTVNEMANVADIQACIALLARFLEEAGSREYGYAEEL